jgi:drug/metabolite transporter (DMT)-like permease
LSVTAIALILVAAIAHASWNLFSKQASMAGAVGFVWLMAVAGAIGYGPAAAAVLIAAWPHLTALNWAFMAGTGVLQAGYFLFLQNGYRLGDLSLVYPIGRGTGAMAAALAGIVLLGERPGPAGLAGVLLIVAGVIVLGIPAQARAPAARLLAPVPAAGAAPVTATGTAGTQPRGSAPTAKALLFAGITGLFIATYTLWDKHAVTTLGTPPLLQAYAAFPVMVVVFAPFALRDRPRIVRVWRSYRPQLLGAAVLAPLAYILVLIALRFSAVSAVAPAREVSVLFGVLLGRRLLGEGSLARRLGGAAAIVAGILAVAVG